MCTFTPEIKACDLTVKEAAKNLNEFIEDHDATHLKELGDFALINATVSWFESLDSDGKKNATQNLKNITFGCMKDFYDRGIVNGTITDDTLLTDDMLFDIAIECIDYMDNAIIYEILKFLPYPDNVTPVDGAADIPVISATDDDSMSGKNI